MGREYKAALQAKIHELGGGSRLRAYINPEGVSPHYLEHLEETFREEGVTFVDSPREANFVFHGDQVESSFGLGQIAAFFRGGRMVFEGEL